MAKLNSPKNILDMVYGSAKTSAEIQKVKRKIISIFTSRAYLESLTHEQAMDLLQNICGCEAVSNKFVIDFYKVNSKNDSIGHVLEKLLESAKEVDDVDLIETDTVDAVKQKQKQVKLIRARLTEELDRRRDIKRDVDNE